MIVEEDVRRARARISTYVERTPVVRSAALSALLGTNVYLKLEVFQKTGAFKVRGAFNKLLSLDDSERRRGVVAVSGGNHAQAVAYAARVLGIRATVLLPRDTPSNYIEATRRDGAEIVLAASMREAFAEAETFVRAGRTYVHPFDDPLVAAGQGVLGSEILEDVPCTTDVIVSIGGGGLACGLGVAVKAVDPSIRVWGVETEGACSMAQSIAAGRVVELERVSTIARTLAVPAVADRTFRLASRLLESVVVVSDHEALDALRLLLECTKILTEPAASCTLAGALRLVDRFAPDRHLVLVLCGGNYAVDGLFAADPILPEVAARAALASPAA